VALILVVDPEDLILPVVRIEGIEVVKEIRFPSWIRAVISGGAAGGN
ncbi:MAG: hypothetical protein HKN43_08900, partial [Rhodothermales bacterium]|nr:hypothetical protein [Rhodothermales bacterium]